MAFVCSHRFDTSRVMAIRPWSCQAHWLSPMDVGVYTYVHGMDYIYPSQAILALVGV